MKASTLTLTALAATLAAAMPMAASAAPWQSINQRQANLEHRINQGIRSGSLTRPEAARLRTDFRSLVRLEARYRRGGLSMRERSDLNHRFDSLSSRIRIQKHDMQHRR